MSDGNDLNIYLDNVKCLRQLYAIYNRYFRKVIKGPLLVHHGDCHIYQAKEIYGFAPCTCGLLHDLQGIYDYKLAEKIYPDFVSELCRSEMTWEQEQNWGPIPEKEVEKFYKDNDIVVNHSCEDEEDKEHWVLIERVFGSEYTEKLKKDYQERESNEI